jgi:multidrug efflux pump subunit AcrB
LRERASGGLVRALGDFEARVATLEGGSGGPASLAGLNGQLAPLLDILQDADVEPTVQVVDAIRERTATLNALLNAWGQLQARDMAALNQRLRGAGLPEISPGR